jgi:hypothetical protein
MSNTVTGTVHHIGPIESVGGLRVGQSVTVHVNLGGREYSGKYYSSITGWKIEASAPPQNQSAPPAEDDTELPF